MKAVTNPGIGHDVLRLVARFDLLAQLVDEDAQVFRLLHALSTPYGIQEHAVGQYFVRVPRHENQQLEFLWRQVDFPASDAHLARFRIDVKIAIFDGLRWLFFRRAHAAKVGPYARQQLIHTERLGNVVVGAGIERLNFTLLFLADREHDDRHLRTLADRATQLDSGHMRHREISHEEVGNPVHGQIQRALPVGGCLHLIALGLQRSLENARNLRFIVDNEDAAALGHQSVSWVTMWTSTAGALARKRLIAAR